MYYHHATQMFHLRAGEFGELKKDRILVMGLPVWMDFDFPAGQLMLVEYPYWHWMCRPGNYPYVQFHKVLNNLRKLNINPYDNRYTAGLTDCIRSNVKHDPTDRLTPQRWARIRQKMIDTERAWMYPEKKPQDEQAIFTQQQRDYIGETAETVAANEVKYLLQDAGDQEINKRVKNLEAKVAHLEKQLSTRRWFRK